VQCLPTGVERIDGDKSSTRSGDGKGSVNVNVAVLDSGIDATDPELNVVGGTNCTHDKLGATVDPAWHGTFVSGIIGARDNASGVVGVAPDARLYSVRVLNKNGSGNTSMILCGIDWVTATRADSDPSNDIALANMSFGTKGSDDGNCGLSKKDPVHHAICNSTGRGIVYVASAGNSADDLSNHIAAAYDEVLTATGIADYDGQPGSLSPPTCASDGRDDTAATFSNYATTTTDEAHTIAAPAVCITSTVPTTVSPNGYATSNGTSFAAPHVTGTVALCLNSAACAGLSPTQILRKIVSDAAAYTTTNPDYGFQGDPLHPNTDNHQYGDLIHAASY
jgi:subtilisin family serine protease